MNDTVELTSAASEGERRPPTLLCVDDEHNILNALKRLFHGERYRVLTADGGATALELLAAEPVDVVISDMRMPEMNGAQFLEQVAQRWPEIVRILLTGYADIESTIAAVNKGQIYQYVSKPWNDEDIKLLVRRALEQKFLKQERQRLEALTQQQNDELKHLNENLENMVAARTSELQQTADMLDLAYAELKQSYSVTVEVFAHLLELREGIGSGHSRRVGEFARKTAVFMGLDEFTVQNVHFAGLLHDIGKIALPDSVLAKPYLSLSEKERKKMEQHPLVGERALLALEPLAQAAHMIRGHHERYDGKGYPDGLKEEAIPIGARILAVTSDFDALMLGTLVEGMFTDDEARNYLNNNAGIRYDPRVVDAFLAAVEPQEQVEESTEIRLLTADLTEGMVLTRDLVHFDGMLLLRAGYELKSAVIGKLRDFEREAGRSYTLYIERR